ncbi:GNAT family N-acetyltransferase [Conexibacter sp. S30A1]|uniref:GNAT family N-acetyltransferase n=1 Tax=Conexibacter sp. S30A1 TaxID=2937800 RepID=UPI00200EF426|nr:GNAT family protein [Conexibacter sp. S30A1]
MSEADARAITSWRYAPPYDFYDGSEADVVVMLDPVNRYRSIRFEGELVGYVCVGPDARVAGQLAASEIDDIGYGFRPDLTGRGIASGWLPEVLETLDDLLRAPRQRVVVAAWNERSLAVARRLGFRDAASFENDHGRWLELVRAR